MQTHIDFGHVLSNELSVSNFIREQSNSPDTNTDKAFGFFVGT